MRLLRLTAALLLLMAGNALFRAGSHVLAGAKAERAGSIPARHPAELLLLSSLVGIAICAVWIWLTARAWQ